MNNEITKIQFRQDTTQNWEETNPILASGEPAISLGKDVVFKIGDGVSHWKDLKALSSTSIVSEAPDDGKLYGRVRDVEALAGTWVEVVIPEIDKRKTINDLYQAELGQEVDMNFSVDVDGTSKKVYGVRKKLTGINIDTREPEKIVDCLSDVYSLIDIRGTFYCGHKHTYVINSYNPDCYTYIYLDDIEHMLKFGAKLNDSKEQLYNCVAEIIVIYTKVAE